MVWASAVSQMTRPAPLRRARLTLLSTTPPPVAMMCPRNRHSSSRTADSRRRKPISPSVSNTWRMLMPALVSITSSASTQGRPRWWASNRATVLLPVPR